MHTVATLHNADGASHTDGSRRIAMPGSGVAMVCMIHLHLPSKTMIVNSNGYSYDLQTRLFAAKLEDACDQCNHELKQKWWVRLSPALHCRYSACSRWMFIGGVNRSSRCDKFCANLQAPRPAKRSQPFGGRDPTQPPAARDQDCGGLFCAVQQPWLPTNRRHAAAGV